MTSQDRLRHAIGEHQKRLRATVPATRDAAILALLRAIDRSPRSIDKMPLPDLISGHHLYNPGSNRALQLCLEYPIDSIHPEIIASGDALSDWATRFLQECHQLAEAEMVLGHCESGFMRMTDDGNGRFHARIASKRTPTSWRERADFDWWGRSVASRQQPGLPSLNAAEPDSPSTNRLPDAVYRQLASSYVKSMSYQIGYPPDATIGGSTIKNYIDVLTWLIGWALRERDHREVLSPQSERSLVAMIATALRVDLAAIDRAVAAFTLDEENVAYHAAVPGVAAAPLVRLGADRITLSLYGLTTEPLLFLSRELRRQHTEEYNNAAYRREEPFRNDLYELFGDKRFITSKGRIELRREKGTVRTDIDAVVFDRKTGTLAFFELKTQDPFARSTAELNRQRDNVLYANRQISGVLAWLNQHGGDSLLNRVDNRVAKSFRVHKVYPFVLGRYLAHFNDGPEPDKRASWGTWPQLLRLLDDQPVNPQHSNPIASLFNRLTKDPSPVTIPINVPPQEIAVGNARITVYPSQAAYQAGNDSSGVRR